VRREETKIYVSNCVFLYYTPKQDYYVVHRPDRFDDNRRRRRRRGENRRAFSHTQSKS
tara:strand:- start:2 stop:175 length:174 start_codon:yes stop_codon:yes gene_type:complete